MAACRMQMFAVGSGGWEARLQGGVCGSREEAGLCAKAQRVAVTAKVGQRRLCCRVVARPGARLSIRCNAASGDGQAEKKYDVNEIVEEVVQDEENQLPAEEKNTPEPLPEGEPSPFSPAIDTDDTETETFQGEGISKDSLIQPPRGLQEGAASASIGEGLGASEDSSLAAGSPVGGPTGSHGRDWRVQSFQELSKGGCSKARVEMAIGLEAHPEQQKKMFGSNEMFCDEDSMILAETGILEADGGKSVDDYKLRAHIFFENAEYFSALKY